MLEAAGWVSCYQIPIVSRFFADTWAFPLSYHASTRQCRLIVVPEWYIVPGSLEFSQWKTWLKKLDWRKKRNGFALPVVFHQLLGSGTIKSPHGVAKPLYGNTTDKLIPVVCSAKPPPNKNGRHDKRTKKIRYSFLHHTGFYKYMTNLL